MTKLPTYLIAPETDIPDRIWSQIDVGDCWLWQGRKSLDGYAKTTFHSKDETVHRIIWASLVGPIPPKMQIDHLCRVRNCLNPDHLEVVTQQLNIARGRTGENMRIKTHCPSGHPYEGDNLHIDPRGHRVCRTCKADWRRRHGLISGS